MGGGSFPPADVEVEASIHFEQNSPTIHCNATMRSYSGVEDSTPTVPSYYLESTASRLISEVKPGQAVLVLWWETTRESAVRYGSFFSSPLLRFFFLLARIHSRLVSAEDRPN